MQKKILPIVYLLIATLIVIASYYFFGSKKINTPKIEIENIFDSKAIDQKNTMDIKTDSFITLAKAAYRDLISIQSNNDLLQITLSNTNKLSSDFFNSNNKLLKYNLDKNDFEINHDPTTGTVNANFKIKGTFVTVPNDVLIMMMYKTYNK